MNSSDDQLKVGLFGIGLEAYWEQFAGLRDTLVGFTDQVSGKLESSRVKVVNLGLVDTPEKSFAAGHEFRKADVDLIFLHVTTYALSSTVLPAVRRAGQIVGQFQLGDGAAYSGGPLVRNHIQQIAGALEKQVRLVGTGAQEA